MEDYDGGFELEDLKGKVNRTPTPPHWVRVTRTRFPELDLWNCRGFWQFANGGSQVGPQYRTKMEALADLPRYAKEYGIEAAQ